MKKGERWARRDGKEAGKGWSGAGVTGARGSPGWLLRLLLSPTAVCEGLVAVLGKGVPAGEAAGT